MVVLTALAEEREAVRVLLHDPRTVVHPAGSRYHVAALPEPGWRLVLGCTGRGNRAAAALTERSIATFRPAAVIFVGIAGAIRPNIALGDLVVATEVYAIHGGREDPDIFRSRPKSWETSHWLLQLAEQVGRDTTWPARHPDVTPSVHLAAIAAGDIVLNSTDSPLARHVRDLYNDAAAVDTESAGVAQAAHLNLATPVMVVRGISDLAAGDKASTDREGWRLIAAANAAAFGLVLAQAIAEDRTRAD